MTVEQSDLPMPFAGLKRGRPSRSEWDEFRRRQAMRLEKNPTYELRRHLPPMETAQRVYELVAPLMPRLRLDALTNRWLPADERNTLGLQVFALLVDLVLHDRTVSDNDMFRALASRLSDWYRRAIETTPAANEREMLPSTVAAGVRDLQLVGLDLDGLKREIRGVDMTERPGLYYKITLEVAGLFRVTLGKHPDDCRNYKKHFHGYGVEVNDYSGLLTQYRAIVGENPVWRENTHQRLVIANESERPLRVDQSVVYEHAYSRTDSADRTIRVMRLASNARRYFDARTYVGDYEDLLRQRESGADYVGIGGVKAEGTSKSLARIYAQALEWLANGTADEHGHVLTKSAVFEGVNRRLYYSDFGPAESSDDKSNRTFLKLFTLESSDRDRWFLADSALRFPPPFPSEPQRVPFAGFDISSQQWQIIAIVCGLDRLEKKLSVHSISELLADRALAKHSDPTDAFTLPDANRFAGTGGYELLKEAMKFAATPLGYGSSWSTVAYELRNAKDSPVGRKATEGARSKHGLGSGANLKELFGDEQLELRPIFEKFLPACTRLAEIACSRDPYGGFMWTKPFDGALIRWNPVRPQRNGKTTTVRAGSLKIEVNAPTRNEPNAAGDYPVDQNALKLLLAPCTIHVLDAGFSGLVVEEMHERGIRDFIAIYDSWYVPADAIRILESAIFAARKPWFETLGGVYDDWLRYFEDDEYGDPAWAEWTRDLRANWGARLAAAQTDEATQVRLGNPPNSWNWPIFKYKSSGPKMTAEYGSSFTFNYRPEDIPAALRLKELVEAS